MGLPVPTLSEADKRRFWSKVDVRGADDCWPWTGATSSNGYGQFWLNRKQFSVHRVSMAIDGRNPVDLFACHRCDNRPCCNPKHLFSGTALDNMSDCAAKGRTAKGDFHGAILKPEKVLRGEGHGNAKLYAAQIIDIRADSRTTREISADYGISQSSVSRIRLRQSWAHVGGVA